MKSMVFAGESIQDLKVWLEENISSTFRPTLGIVFVSGNMDRQGIDSLLESHSIAYFGLTTNGEFINCEMHKDSAVLMLLDMNPEHFRLYNEKFHDNDYRGISSKIARQALKEIENPSFLLGGSHLETDAEQLLFGIADVVGPDVEVYGGMAGENFMLHEGNFVFTNGWESERGVLILALDRDHIQMHGKATCGWTPMGTPKTVTRSEGNRIYTIDGMTALDITKKYSGLENLTEDNPDLMLDIACNFPMQLQRDQGDPVMRPGLKVNWEDGSFSCSGTIPEGSKVRFSLPPDFDVIEKVIDGCKDMKQDKMPEADAVIIFSCGGRLMALGPLMKEEISGIYDIWEAPMIGMFSNGELGRATGGQLEFHNLTTCCIALKEI